MKITKAKVEDIDHLVELFDAYRMFYGKESDIEGAREFLEDRLSGIESQIFIALEEEDGEEILGFVQLYPLYSSTRMKRLWLLNDLYVRPEFRGQGISKKLIERAKILCRETKACGLILETAKDNTIGNQLYPAVGFELDNEHHYYSWDA
jgi:GNAT superfamily N-acetyltransferase